ncbi:MAG: hypothetical protein IK066_07400 [Kiritimatiellae bacterium]|nr:hypothetical protein [Kiritimatiellia bacterium]
MKVKQLVVFLCEEKDWTSYKKSNPSFKKNDTCLYYISNAEGAERAFVVLKWSEKHKEGLRLMLIQGKHPTDMTKMAWCQEILESWTPLLTKDAQVDVFVHWGGTTDETGMKKPSVELQKYLHSTNECATWQIFSLSSHGMDLDVRLSKSGRIFDVGGPTIPVSNFKEWFSMYETWWNAGEKGGKNAVESRYNGEPGTFPNHKDGGGTLPETLTWDIASLGESRFAPEPSEAFPAVEAHENAEGERTAKGCAQEQGDNGSSSNPAAPKSFLSNVRKWLKMVAGKVRNRMGMIVAFVIGLAMFVVALAPLLLVKQYLSIVPFQARTTRGGVAVLLVAIMAAAFAECVLGGLFWLLRGCWKHSEND